MHEPGSGLSPLPGVASTLEAAGIAYALIGAAALAVHGVSRSTFDLDLLAVDRQCLTPGLWKPLEERGWTVEIRRGGMDDPLAGVVRVSSAAAQPVDLVIGRSTWQRGSLARAVRARVGGTEIPVLRPPDLVLLKLFAGGPQDAWDVQQLLATEGRGALISEVESLLGELPPHAAALWRRIHELGPP
jgi:hypothetical protein